MEAGDAEVEGCCKTSMAVAQLSRSARSAASAVGWAYSVRAMTVRGVLLAFVAVRIG